MRKLYVIELGNGRKKRVVYRAFYSWKEANHAFKNLPVLTEWSFAELRTYTTPTRWKRTNAARNTK